MHRYHFYTHPVSLGKLNQSNFIDLALFRQKMPLKAFHRFYVQITGMSVVIPVSCTGASLEMQLLKGHPAHQLPNSFTRFPRQYVWK